LCTNLRIEQNKILPFLKESSSKTNKKPTFLKFCRIFQNFAEFFTLIGRKTLLDPEVEFLVRIFLTKMRFFERCDLDALPLGGNFRQAGFQHCCQIPARLSVISEKKFGKF